MRAMDSRIQLPGMIVTHSTVVINYLITVKKR